MATPVTGTLRMSKIPEKENGTGPRAESYVTVTLEVPIKVWVGDKGEREGKA